MNRDLALKGSEGGWQVGPHLGAPAADSASQAPPALDFSKLIHIMREWRWLIVAATVLGLVLGILAALLTTPEYRATVTLEVNPPTVEIMDGQREEMASGASTWDFVLTQVGLLRSRSLAQRVAEDLNLANDPNFAVPGADPAARLSQATSTVASNLKVIPPEDGQLISFEYISESPQRAAEIANAYATAFINSSLQRRYEASAYARGFLERQIAKTRTDLERSERQLVGYAQAQGIINTSDGKEGSPGGDASSLQGQSLVALNSALANATARRVAAEGAYRQAVAVGATADPTSAGPLRQTRAALEAEYQEKRTLMKPDHPEMVSLRSRIEELDRQVARETAVSSSSRANALLADYRAAAAAERALQARVAGLKGQVLDLRGRSIQYTILQREVDTNRALYDALLQRYKEIGVAGGVGAAPVSIVDRADAPGAPFKPDLTWNVLVGLFLGLLTGVAAAIGLELLNDTIKTRADVRDKLGLACLGVIPKRARKTPLIEDLEESGSAIAEAYSTLATSLRFTTEQGAPKVMMITSSRAAEGKSSTALSLATIYARRGKSVLLLDGDLRRPAFRAGSDKIGLTKLLTTEDHFADHVTPTQFENLFLLPCGPVPPNPADLLSTGRFRAVVREAASQYDMVIIDAPPVLGLADAPLLASVAEHVLLVVESGRTRTSAALDALHRLRAAGAALVGATLTKSTEERSTYGYGAYGYGYRALDKDRRDTVLLTDQTVR